MKIDLSQSNAIRHESGPAMILAGPGSGKTTVITHRVEYMIRHLHIDPASILVITFSRAAAVEMRERFLLLSGRQYFPVTFGTFHAIFFHILKSAYSHSSLQIAGENLQIRFVRDHIRRLRLEGEDETELARNILSEISFMKNMAAVPADYCPVSCEADIFRLIYDAYREFLYQNRMIDFDDMLVMTKELFEKRNDILSAWQNRYIHILVDEFQDINPLQYEIVRMLSMPQDNLFIVGDDDQSIYRFRGARPEIMLNFGEDYPEARKIILETNYRSTPEIVETAGNLISHNQKRFSKEIRAASAPGSPPVFRSFESQREQNLFVIQTIRKLNREMGIPFHETAVLVRTNAQPRLLMLQLAGHNIPYVSKEHIPCLYEHWIMKDINTYLSLALGDRRRSSFLRVMNRPDRFLSRESLPFEQVTFSVWSQFYDGDRRRTDRIRGLETDLSILAGMSPFSAVNFIRKAMGYEDFLRNYAAKRRMGERELLDVLDDIQKDAEGFDSVEKWFDFQKTVCRNWRDHRNDDPGSEKDPDPAVVLSTLHAAKGLEFDTVFLIDLNETVMPDKKALTQDDLEEERRLFYVGMTRAKRRLYLLHSGQIKNKKMVPSRFLSDCTKSTEP